MRFQLPGKHCRRHGLSRKRCEDTQFIGDGKRRHPVDGQPDVPELPVIAGGHIEIHVNQ